MKKYNEHTLFLFFRGTFYRWTQLFPEICRDLSRAPKLLAVGDLHVGSFGTWRDFEGRLNWGVDDFDDRWLGSSKVQTRLGVQRIGPGWR